jgi:hypothetical protein
LAQIDCLDKLVNMLRADKTRDLAALRGDEPSGVAPEPMSDVDYAATAMATDAPLTFAAPSRSWARFPGGINGDEICSWLRGASTW